MVDNLRFWFIFLCIGAAILFVGWKQPLRYRFLSAQEIYVIEHPEPPPPPPPDPAKDNSWMYDPRRQTLLDRNPYNPNGYRSGGNRTNSQSSSGSSPYSR